MTENGHLIICLPVIIVIALVFNCTTLFHSVGIAAEEERITLSHDERVQYHVIKVVQRKLIENGYHPGPVNGMNDQLTQEAIKNYQRDHGLIVDGIPGPQTLKSLGY